MADYDAIIIGAGPAGSTAALLLARAGWSVAVIEKAAFPRRKICGEFISAPALALLGRAGIAEEILAGAGPEVRDVGVFAGDRIVTGAMPRHDSVRPERSVAKSKDERPVMSAIGYGRALGREHLDALLLAAAARAGASVWQPWRVRSWARANERYVCVAENKAREHAELHAPVLIAAHGSWDTGGLTVPGAVDRSAPSDLLAFKAHFGGCDLPRHRMPLIAFPGGYGGLVHSDRGRVSFSCCIRRDVLTACRAETPGASAGAAVLAHVLGACRGMREAIGAGVRDGEWLAAGPLRPGIRSACADGYFTLGNAHGEAHPIVAEGINMAIQSAWLLCERLVPAGPRASCSRLEEIARAYELAYRASFGPRIRAASAFATLAMQPKAAAAVTALLQGLPGLLAFGARWAGKAATYETRQPAAQTAAAE